VTYVITEACIDVKDASCVEVCPVDCIVHEDVDRRLYINPDECIDCGACVDPCPVEAIHSEEDVPAGSREWVVINHLYFRDREAARARVEELAPAVLAVRGG